MFNVYNLRLILRHHIVLLTSSPAVSNMVLRMFSETGCQTRVDDVVGFDVKKYWRFCSGDTILLRLH